MTSAESLSFNERMYISTCEALKAAMEQNATLSLVLEQIRKERDDAVKKNRQLEKELTAARQGKGGSRRFGNGYW